MIWFEMIFWLIDVCWYEMCYRSMLGVCELCDDGCVGEMWDKRKVGCYL